MSGRTPEQNRRYNATARAKAAARGQCPLCPTLLPKGFPWRVCDSCRERQRARYKPGQPKRTKVFLPPAERIAIYQRWKESGLTTREFAPMVGKSVFSLRFIVWRVGQAVKGIEPKAIGPRVGPRAASRQAYPRCKCGLLLPCWNCVTAAGEATRRIAA